jgi:hypothetical protein
LLFGPHVGEGFARVTSTALAKTVRITGHDDQNMMTKTSRLR